MICRAIGFVIAAIVVGLLTWWLFGKVAAWLAIIAFLGLFALGLWLVLKFCGEPDSASVAAPVAAPAAADPAPAAVDQAAAQAEADAAAKAQADAAAKAEADAAAKAEADAAAQAEAQAKAEAEAKAAEAEAARIAAGVVAAGNGNAGSTPDFDGDGVLEGTGEGSRPAALDGPRDGKADNLKEIKGVGPKMEKLLNSLGFYHFDQVASWTADEVAWVDANLEGFKGRVSRDEWVKQAQILASGGETEFSKRVDEGDVY